jgi:hypothetical protein
LKPAMHSNQNNLQPNDLVNALRTTLQETCTGPLDQPCLIHMIVDAPTYQQNANSS